jgi:hypothetical protein
MRLLRCFDCKTMEEFPDPPKGVDPKNISPGEDPLLDALLEKHKTNQQEHLGQMFDIPDKDWANPDARKQILEQINEKTTGFEQEFYDVKNTFQEDALKCFQEHNRPDRCIDWLSDRKKLGRATPEGKAWQKQNQKAPQTYLCHFCPVASKVMVAQRAAAGAYKES